MRIALALIALFGTSSLALDIPSDAPVVRSKPSEGRPSHTGPPEQRGPIQGVSVMVDFEERAAIEEAVAAYLAGVYAENLARLAAEVLERQAAAAEAERAAAARRPVIPVSHPGSTVGDCTGFAIPAYIIQRESGGNPSAYNPSGAYGCAQTLLSHYSGGSCRGLDPYTIDGQRACVDILSAGGTNLSPWAQTR